MIRLATAADAAALIRIRNAAIDTLASSHYRPADIIAWRDSRDAESYLAPILTKLVLVDERDGELVAFGQLDAVIATIDALYVAPKWTGCGVGLTLLRALESHAQALDIRALKLDASFNAVSFYRRAGYTIKLVRTDSTDGNLEKSATVAMERSLF
jgi:GNAT superfamily N-acetyltransferase